MSLYVYIHNMYKWMRISGMRTSNWAGSWYPPTGQPLGQGFLEMCPMVPSKHSFAQVPCTCASDVCMHVYYKWNAYVTNYKWHVYIALDYEYDEHVSVYVHIYIYSYIHNYIYMHTHHSRSHKLATNHLLYHRFLFTLRNGQGHRFFIAERPQLGPLGRIQESQGSQ